MGASPSSLFKKVVRVERKNEKDKLKEFERQKRELAPALAQSHLKNLCLEALIEGVEKIIIKVQERS